MLNISIYDIDILDFVSIDYGDPKIEDSNLKVMSETMQESDIIILKTRSIRSDKFFKRVLQELPEHLHVKFGKAHSFKGEMMNYVFSKFPIENFKILSSPTIKNGQFHYGTSFSLKVGDEEFNFINAEVPDQRDEDNWMSATEHLFNNASEKPYIIWANFNTTYMKFRYWDNIDRKGYVDALIKKTGENPLSAFPESLGDLFQNVLCPKDYLDKIKSIRKLYSKHFHVGYEIFI